MSVPISGGIAYIKINGVQFMVRGSAKIKPANLKRTGIVNQDQTVVFTEAGAIPEVSLTLSDYGALSIAQIVAVKGATLIIYLRSGKSYVLNNATYVGDTELNTEDGTIPVMFQGTYCNEQVAKQ